MATAFIVFVEFCERLGYYTIAGTKKSWLQDQGYSNAHSSTLVQIFGVLAAVSCLFGGWLADTRLGRHRTILSLVVLYVTGCFLTAIASHPGVESVPMYLIGSYVFIALGTGGIKPNVCNFGADQIDPCDKDAERKTSSFFTYFYMTINVGAVIAFGFFATLATNGMPPLVPKVDGYFVTYTIGACLMLLAFLIFVGGTPFYRKESLLTNSDSSLARIRSLLWKRRNFARGMLCLFGWALLPVLVILSVLSAFVDSWGLTLSSLVVGIVSVGCLSVAHNNNAWLGEDPISQSFDCVPALLIGNISFNILMNAMGSYFYAQSCQMDTRLGNRPNAPQLNGAIFSLADGVAVILFTPVVDRLLIPGLEYVMRRRVTLNMKIYAGILVACLAQLSAAFIEYARRSAPSLDIGSNCAPLEAGSSSRHVPMSSISAWWMIIPYGLTGMGEVLVNPVLQHYAYDGADPSLRSIMQAFNIFCGMGMSSAFSAALNEAMSSFTPNNLDDGDITIAYYINVALGLLGCGLYFCVGKAAKGDARKRQLPVILGQETAAGNDGISPQDTPKQVDRQRTASTVTPGAVVSHTVSSASDVASVQV